MTGQLTQLWPSISLPICEMVRIVSASVADYSWVKSETTVKVTELGEGEDQYKTRQLLLLQNNLLILEHSLTKPVPLLSLLGGMFRVSACPENIHQACAQQLYFL